MATYIIALVCVFYLAVCVGLLNQTSTIRGLERAKSFIPFVPFIYIILLLRAFLKLLSKRNEESRLMFCGYLRLKSALLIMLFSYSQVKSEIKLERKRKPKNYKQVNYPQFIKKTSDKIWENMECAVV